MPMFLGLVKSPSLSSNVVLLAVDLVERGGTNGRRKDIVTEENKKEENKRRRNERKIERKTKGCRLPLHFPLDAL